MAHGAWRASAAVGAVVAVLAAGAGSASGVRTPGHVRGTGTSIGADSIWQVVYHSANRSDLGSVVALSGKDAWAGGYLGKPNHPEQALAMRWNGAKWSYLKVPDARSLRSAGLAASSASDVWLFGGNGKILRWNGHAWITVPSIPGALGDVNASADPGDYADVLSKSDVWVLGGWSAGTKIVTEVSHWNGHDWKVWTVPHLAGTGISAVSASDAWIVGNETLSAKARITAQHWNGKSWQPVQMQHPYDYLFLPEIAMASGSNVWLGTTSATGPGDQPAAEIMHWTHGDWTSSGPGGPLPAADQQGFISDGSGGVWDGPFNDYNGSGWSQDDPGASLLPGLSYQFSGIARIPGTAQLWVVGKATTSGAARSPWTALISGSS